MDGLEILGLDKFKAREHCEWNGDIKKQCSNIAKVS